MRLWQALGLPPATRLGVIGGGGKTSILFQLAQEAHTLGYEPLVTTTTQMYLPRQQSDWLAPATWEERGRQGAGVQFLYTRQRPESDKVVGISPAQLDQLPRSTILYEADGSRGRPIKIHGQHEPQLGLSTSHTLVVIGWSAWGRPLDSTTVHRSELLGDLEGKLLDAESADPLLGRMLDRTVGVPLVVINQAGAQPEEARRWAQTGPRIRAARVVVLREREQILEVYRP